jgi:hypothetical protein
MSSIAVLMLTTVLQGASTCKCCGSTQVKAGGGKTCGKEHSWTRAGGWIDCQTVDRGPGCMLAGSNPKQRQSFSLQIATVADQGGAPSIGVMFCVCVKAAGRTCSYVMGGSTKAGRSSGKKAYSSGLVYRLILPCTCRPQAGDAAAIHSVKEAQPLKLCPAPSRGL